MTAEALKDREPEVKTALQKQQNSICELHEAIDRLRSKISPALRQEPQPDNVGEKISSNSTVPLANEMRNIADVIDGATKKVREAIMLCEL